MGRRRVHRRTTSEELLVAVDDDRFDSNMYCFGCETTRLRGHVDLRNFAAWDADGERDSELAGYTDYVGGRVVA